MAASAAPPGSLLGSHGGFGSCGASDADGRLPPEGCELVGVVPEGGARATSDGAGQQCGGVPEQRAPDAPGASSHRDAGAAGPEAAVLELSRVSRGEAAGSLPLRALGPETAQLPLLGSARDADTDSRGDLTQEVSSSKVTLWDVPRTGSRNS